MDFEVFFNKVAQYSFLKEQTYADILNEQVCVEHKAEIVGQINGLSVIWNILVRQYLSLNLRVLVVLCRIWRWEVIDVERKNELAGNIHGKGMMIAQACLFNILDLPSQLPFSASLVLNSLMEKLMAIVHLWRFLCVSKFFSRFAFCLNISQLQDRLINLDLFILLVV